MEVKEATTEIFQKEFPTGGSHPSLFDCSDGFRYVVKHSQQRQNYKHLINELIAAQLAKVVSVPIPDFALIEIKTQFYLLIIYFRLESRLDWDLVHNFYLVP